MFKVRPAGALLFSTIFVMVCMFFLYLNMYRSTTVRIFNNINPSKDTKERGGTLPNNKHGRCSNSIKNAQSLWFRESHDENLMPFWSSDRMAITADVFQWWLSIQGSKRSDLEPVLKALFKSGIQQHPKRNGTWRGCISCAVVGNSWNLKNSEYGQKIDNHDIVIRFNKAPTVGFENDVGSKTTHQIMYPESAKQIPKETSFTLIPFKPLDVEWLYSAITNGTITRTYQPVPAHIDVDITKINIIHPEFIRYVHINWINRQGRYPSTGVIGVALALQICDSVDIYGFGMDENRGWNHYWENLSPKIATAFRKTGVHNADVERSWLERLKTEGIVSINLGKLIGD